MSFSDLLNQNAIDLYNSHSVPIGVFVFNILVAFLLSLIVLYTYKRSYQSTVYNKSFALGLPVITMVTSLVIIAVASNIILSLGMVGALSIVRFRTALKNPFDTVIVFWTIGVGITIGAGLIVMAVVSTVVISAVIFLLQALEVFTSSYFLIVRANSYKDEKQILNSIEEIYKKYTVKNKTVKNNSLDLTLEVRSKEDKIILINQIQEIDSVVSVVLLSHNGDYISE